MTVSELLYGLERLEERYIGIMPGDGVTVCDVSLRLLSDGCGRIILEWVAVDEDPETAILKTIELEEHAETSIEFQTLDELEEILAQHISPDSV